MKWIVGVRLKKFEVMVAMVVAAAVA